MSGFTSFSEFYPFYLGEHSNRTVPPPAFHRQHAW